MSDGYFQRVTASTPTRLWVNNPTPGEARDGIAAGARGCTTNPTYAARMLAQLGRAERERLLEEINLGAADADLGVDAVQCRMVEAILPIFAPLRAEAAEAAGATEAQAGPFDGLVSVQGNPHHDTDTLHILGEAERHARLGGNVILKVPATQAGLVAIEALLRQGRPVLATEMMSVAQTRALCASYRRAAAASPRCGLLIATHITGIFDQALATQAARLAPDLDPSLLAEAGLLVARRVRGVLDQEGLPIALMGGGARGPRHFTGMVGGDALVTINPDMIARLEGEDPPVVDRFSAGAGAASSVATLRAFLPDFRCAWDEDGLALEEFEQFAPIRLFLSLFIAGWDAVRGQLVQARATGAVG